jgi:SAM-dependent MidA family methyltransferase
MEAALYHPEHGYYRRGQDPFGKAGDFYTAEQLQPVFGLILAAYLGSLRDQMNSPADFLVAELGAGRAEMAEGLAGFRYLPVDVERGWLPERFRGVVFANEFFDALPVHVAIRRGEGFREMRVGLDGERFRWIECGPVDAGVARYLWRYCGSVEEGAAVEANLDALRWIEEISRRLERGFLFVIDYGYTARELARFPRGTLMSYRRHIASEDVLAGPGDRDLTAHVNFTALEDHAAGCGFEKVRFESLSLALLRAGEPDNFASALAAGGEKEAIRRRLQLKTLLFGMGETLRTLLLRKAVRK